MNILSFNPGHDGAFAYLENGRLIFSLKSEKHSHYRHSPLSATDVFDVLAEVNDVPDVLCRGGWWPNDANLAGQHLLAGYRGINSDEIVVGENWLLGKKTKYFSSSTSVPTSYALSVCQIWPRARLVMLCCGKVLSARFTVSTRT